MRNKNLETPLHVALRGDNPEKASTWLIEMGADITAVDGARISIGVLAWVTCKPAFDMMKARLLQIEGGEVEKVADNIDSDWVKAQRYITKKFKPVIGGFNMACILGLPEAESMLDAGAVNVNYMGYSSIQSLMKRGHYMLLRQLNSYDTIMGMSGGCSGKQPIHEAVITGNIGTVELLIQDGADVNATDSQGMQPIHFATKYGRAEIVQLLLDRGAHVDACVSGGDNEGEQPIHIAAARGHVEIVRLLYNYGADLTSLDGNRKQAIHIAVCYGHVDILELLLARGVDVNTCSGKSAQPHITGKNRQNEMLQWALKVRRTKQHQDVTHIILENTSGTPIHYAVIQGYVEIVKFLLRSRADVNACDINSDTPLHWAALYGNIEIAQLLVQEGASVVAMNKKGQQPIHIAANHGKIEIIKLLISHGADVDACDAKGRSPIHFADSLEVVQLLGGDAADFEQAIKDGIQRYSIPKT